jgi:hypothetical protein
MIVGHLTFLGREKNRFAGSFDFCCPGVSSASKTIQRSHQVQMFPGYFQFQCIFWGWSYAFVAQLLA